MSTEEKIIAKALEMYNERGIEYVGLRELAAVLGIRVGNITYYFPTKDDLVNRLSLDLAKENAKIVVENDQLTIRGFLEMFRQVFHNHIQYRCLLLSFVHLMKQNKLMAERYKDTEQQRWNTLKANILSLRSSGYLAENFDVEFLVSLIVMVVRFWISEAAISRQHMTPEQQIWHYLELLAKSMIPYSTEKGKTEIEEFLNEKPA